MYLTTVMETNTITLKTVGEFFMFGLLQPLVFFKISLKHPQKLPACHVFNAKSWGNCCEVDDSKALIIVALSLKKTNYNSNIRKT